VIISFLTFDALTILPTVSAAKFIVIHDPSFGVVTSTKRRDEEFGAHGIFWRINSLYNIYCETCMKNAMNIILIYIIYL
jgi:hypothetical protein